MTDTSRMLNERPLFQRSLQPDSESRRRPLVVAAVPAYNEERTIAKVVLVASKYVDKVIVCDDGSNDLTAEIARELKADVIQHDTNRGYGSAIRSLLKRARELRADTVVTIDADGQHDATQIPVLLEALERTQADIVVGSRFLSDENPSDRIPTYRRYGIRAITKISGLASSQKISDAQSGLRAYGRKVLDSMNLSEDGMGLSVEVLMEAKKHGFRIVEVPTTVQYKGLERSSTQAPLTHAIRVITTIARLVAEDRPLLFLGMPGVISILVGMVFGIWLLQIYAQEHHIVTNIALASMTFTIIGLFAVFTSITLYSMSRIVKKSLK